MKDYDMVIFIKPVQGDTRVIPIATVGTIVDTHNNGEAFEVEIGCGVADNPEVVTVKADCLIGTGMDKEAWQACQKLAEMLKNGEITQDDIRKISEEIDRRGVSYEK
jgi:hypothetical protein